MGKKNRILFFLLSLYSSFSISLEKEEGKKRREGEGRNKKKEGMCKVTRIYGNQDTSDNECEYWNPREREKGTERKREKEEREIIYEKRKILFLVSSDSDTQEKERGIN